MENGFLVLVPLFCSSPIEIGGLGFPPSVIGTFLAIFGIVDGGVQALFGAKLIEWFGVKKTFCYTVLSFYPMILLFPIMSAVVIAQGKVGPIIWILLFMQLIFFVLMDLAYRAYIHCQGRSMISLLSYSCHLYICHESGP